MLDGGSNIKESKQISDAPESKSSPFDRLQSALEKAASKVAEMFSDDYKDGSKSESTETAENSEASERQESNEGEKQESISPTFNELFERMFSDDFVDDLKQSQENDQNNTLSVDLKETVKVETRLPTSNGFWDGEKGNSTWKPDPDYIPPEKSRNPDRPYSNPESLTWGEIMEKYGIDGIEYKDGYPVFNEVSRGTVEIDDFTDDRGSNFDQADEKMAEQRGCTPEEVAKWREENGYTWHECQDCKTMQKVPNEVHANVPHDGGVSVYKSNN